VVRAQLRDPPVAGALLRHLVKLIRRHRVLVRKLLDPVRKLLDLIRKLLGPVRKQPLDRFRKLRALFKTGSRVQTMRVRLPLRIPLSPRTQTTP
jgi:hypothetical protein